MVKLYKKNLVLRRSKDKKREKNKEKGVWNFRTRLSSK